MEDFYKKGKKIFKGTIILFTPKKRLIIQKFQVNYVLNYPTG